MKKILNTSVGLFLVIAGLFLTVIMILSLLRGDRIDPKKTYGPAHNYQMPWLDGTEKSALDTMKAIIPKGKGVIEYEDGTHDSIRWGYNEDEVTRGVAIDPTQSDEYHMWITGEGDTIWE